MSEDLEAAESYGLETDALESDAVGRVPAEAHESIVRAPAVPTPEERALDVELAIIARRKWRRVSPHKPQLSCPLCGSSVADDGRAMPLHIEDHKRRELAATAAGLPPGHEVLAVDYASMAERATRHAHWAVAAALVLMFVTALTIAMSVL